MFIFACNTYIFKVFLRYTICIHIIDVSCTTFAPVQRILGDRRSKCVWDYVRSRIRFAQNIMRSESTSSSCPLATPYSPNHTNAHIKHILRVSPHVWAEDLVCWCVILSSYAPKNTRSLTHCERENTLESQESGSGPRARCKNIRNIYSEQHSILNARLLLREPESAEK